MHARGSSENIKGSEVQRYREVTIRLKDVPTIMYPQSDHNSGTSRVFGPDSPASRLEHFIPGI